MSCASYHDELTAAIDAFLAEPIPEEATDEDRETYAAIVAQAADFRRHQTARPPRKGASR